MEIGEQSGHAEVQFSLRAIHRCISGQQALADPALLHLIVEDACWQREMGEWHARRPRRWRRKQMRRWIADGIRLFSDKEQLQQSARRLGL